MTEQCETVWVLGANSFTGRYLIPELRTLGYLVDTSNVDITDRLQVRGAMARILPDVVINLAAISFVPDGRDESIYAINTFGAEYILDASCRLKKRPRVVILASSSSVYGLQDKDILDEECKPNPVDHYGCSKWAMEQIARTYSERLNVLITRPFNYTGVGQSPKFLIPKITQHFKQKVSTLKLGSTDVSRDFSDVRWIASAYAALLAVEVKGVETLNLCSGKMTSIDEILALLHQLTGVSIKVESDMHLVRNVDIKRQCGSNQRLYRLVPSLAKPIDIEETLREMVS